jgi:protein-tyrosine phosphatase
MALRMLRKGQIHLLGSDCHNLTDRKPDLGPALDWIEARLGTETVQKINQCGAAVLSDDRFAK